MAVFPPPISVCLSLSPDRKGNDDPSLLRRQIVFRIRGFSPCLPLSHFPSHSFYLCFDNTGTDCLPLVTTITSPAQPLACSHEIRGRDPPNSTARMPQSTYIREGMGIGGLSPKLIMQATAFLIRSKSESMRTIYV